MSKPVFRCSEFDRRLSCPGSRTLEAIVAPRQGDEGEEGTDLHAKIAFRICVELGGSCALPVGKLRPVGFADWIVGYCFREVQQNVPDDWSLECEVGLAYEWPQFVLSGHIDCLALNADATEAIFWDWKTGRDPVDPADNNEQGLGYIILLKRAYPSLRKATFKLCQPHNDEDEGFQRVSTVTVEWTGDECHLATALERRLNAAIAAPMSLDTGKWCRWCSASVQCPAILKLRENMKHTLTPEELARITKTPDDAILGDWAVDAKTLAGPIKDANALLHARLDATPAITAGCGVHISRKITGGSYEVTEPQRFYTELRQLEPDPDKLAPHLKFSMTSTKELIATALDVPKTGKAAVTAETVFDAKFRPLVVQGERKLFVFQ